MLRNLLFVLGIGLTLGAFSLKSQADDLSLFAYSPYGEEMEVSFDAIYLTPFTSIAEMNATLPVDRSYYVTYTIEPTLKYLFGPLTHRGWGGVKKTLSLNIDWNKARETSRGVELLYSYKGLWLLDVKFFDLSNPQIPLPFNTVVVLSDQWKKCTDAHHDTQSFYWYYWEPTRPGCDQTVGNQFQLVSPILKNRTQETVKTFPEYQKMIRKREGKLTFPMTFGFGYYEEPGEPNPDTDKDVGAKEYQMFLRELKKQIPANFTEKPILRSSYPFFFGRDFTVGHSFSFTKDGVQFTIKVVMNSGIDQMILFARSYAEEHDSYFGWVGHSRVGSGFDAIRFAGMLKEQPNLYTISKDYQLIYWGGCNSYSYYTEPFFKLKAATIENDPNGSKFLDIVANGLPSYFGLNATNALIHSKALLNFKNPTSYQEILNQMERMAEYFGTHVLAIVLGDEDNN